MTDAVVARAVTLQLVSAEDARWTDAIGELLPTREGCSAFVEWATHHPTWSFNVADASAGVCAKPREAAIAILT